MLKNTVCPVLTSADLTELSLETTAGVKGLVNH